MKGTIFVASVALVIALVSANCPASCSGHGICVANDLCTCYPNYKGNDCSERVCPYASAFSDVPSADNTAHGYLECSGKGVCDRKSGACKCFAGYEGEACRRTTCPNLCSGHGTCETMAEMAADTSPAANGAANRVFNTWESEKHQLCKCDAYWHGVDCSERSCPKGDDPLTTGQISVKQVITLAKSGEFTAGSFTLTFTDKFNGVWTTKPITPTTTAAASITGGVLQIEQAKVASALNGLPNQVIQGATVVIAPTTNNWVITVTWDSKYNSGNPNSLTVNAAGCATAGCAPYFAALAPTTTGSVASQNVADNSAITTATTNLKEDATCSNRGACDEATGKCACHSGYFGNACEMQTALF